MRGRGDREHGRVRVLGVDPGTAVTGWGVIEQRGVRFYCLGHGTVATRPGTALAAKLAVIHRALADRCGEWEPDVVALEKSFVGRNVQSAFRLGEVRGVTMLVAANAGLTVAEYTPAAIKLAVTGNGRAEKAQVERAVVRELALKGPVAPDAADALAAAICHLQSARLHALVAGTRAARVAAS